MVRPPAPLPDETDASERGGYAAAHAETSPLEPSVESAPEPALDPPTLRDITAPATLRDPEAQAQFADLGYAVVDLISEDQAQLLLEQWQGLHPGRHDGSSWECDFYSDDSGVKEKAFALIQDAFADAISEKFVDHETFLHNFVMNWPGDDGGLELHQHSSVVDEERFRSAVIWCALTDATEENGTLLIIPRSHRVLHHHKPERSPEWFEGLNGYLVENHLVAVTLRPGQALVFDNGLLHCSFANRTDAPRVTAVATLAPKAAALRYYDWVDEGSINVYELESSFFIEHVSRQVEMEWAKPEGLEVVGVERFEFRRLTQDEAALLLPVGEGGKGDPVAGWLQPSP